MRGEEDPHGVPLVVLDEVREDVCVTEDVVVRVFAEDAVKEEEAVLVDVGLGSRVTVALRVRLAVDVPEPVKVGHDELDGVCVGVTVSVGDIRGLRDPVTEDVLVLDTVEDRECVGVEVCE